jgi:hypothetical protein
MSALPDPRRTTLQLPKDIPASRTARSAVDGWLSGVDRGWCEPAAKGVTSARPAILKRSSAGSGSPLSQPSARHIALRKRKVAS